MEALNRQWAMLRLIPRHPRRIDTGRLREQLEQIGYSITLRSIQRDLNKLSLVLPLCCDQSKPQGWWWSVDAEVLDIPGLDPNSAMVFKMAELHLSQILPTSSLETLKPWFKAATGVLDQHAGGAGKWLDKVRILPRGLPLLPPTIDPVIQSTVYEALLDSRRFSIRYLAYGATEEKEYEVNPLAIVQRDHLIYIVCTFWDYDNPMLLLMHRIRAATLLEKSSWRPDGFDLDDYIERGELSFRLGPPIKLIVDFKNNAARLLFETSISHDQSLADGPDGVVRLCATVADTIELRVWLRGFGSDVIVISPSDLLAQNTSRHASM